MEKMLCLQAMVHPFLCCFLIAYLYAFYESMKIDMTVQFDLLPISVRKNDHSSSQDLLGAYFNDQTLR